MRIGATLKARSGMGIFELLIPNFSKAVPTLILAECNRRMALLRIAAERFRRKHGRYPGRAEELVPEYLAAVPLDPLDGKPMRYRIGEDGKPLLYSVGLDGVDNGGTGDAVDDWQRSSDWPWPRLVSVKAASAAGR